MLDVQTFKTVIENTPLVSIDLCLVCNNQLLLGKRTNEPLKGEWFTPGGSTRFIVVNKTPVQATCSGSAAVGVLQPGQSCQVFEQVAVDGHQRARIGRRVLAKLGKALLRVGLCGEMDQPRGGEACVKARQAAAARVDCALLWRSLR